MKQKYILILPGWRGSGHKHWQSIWLKKYPNAIEVVQGDWQYPKKQDWVKTLDEFIEKYRDRDIILVGHSLACATIAYWSKEYASKNPAKIKGALLVCPSDVEQSDFPKEIEGFSPMPLEPLNFKTIVVTSSNDPYVTVARAEYFTECWGGELVNIGSAGHINADAGFGEWPEGEKLLEKLM